MTDDWAGFGPATYGDRIARVYDLLYGGVLDTPGTVERLAALAGDGPILELGVGTGRIACPLSERGITVHGIDASEAMVAELRARPGGDRVAVTIGDFADVGADGPFTLVYVVFNTFFGLITQDDQLRCFENVARRLVPGGAFLIEVFVPDLTRFTRGQNLSTVRVELDGVMLDATRVDTAAQRIDSQHVVIAEEGIRLYPVRIRYAWPTELDLMARLAGLRLRERHGGWHGEPFTAASTRHVSVYERA